MVHCSSGIMIFDENMKAEVNKSTFLKKNGKDLLKKQTTESYDNIHITRI